MATACAVVVQAMDAEEREGRSKYRQLRRKLGGSKSKAGSKSRSRSSCSKSPQKCAEECRAGWLGFDLGGTTSFDAFTDADDNGDGRLCKSEFKDIFTDYTANDGVSRDSRDGEKCLDAFDRNGDGKIDFPEFDLLVRAVGEYRCATVIFQPANDSDVYGWAQILEPLTGPNAGSSQITANIYNFPSNDGRIRPNDSNEGGHGFHIHKFDDLGNNCSDTSRHYNPPEPEDDVNKAPTWFIGELQQDTLTVDANGNGSYSAWDPLVSLDPDYEFNVVDRSLVVHDNDCTPDSASCPSANKKTRIACGAIRSGCYLNIGDNYLP